MLNPETLIAFLDSMKDPLVFADTSHIIQYMNKAATDKYSKRWGTDLIGKSLMHCHNEQSQQKIIEVFSAMQKGEEERLITDKDKYRVYMRAVRTADGALIGYYEWYEHKAK